jgi:hypothetical protein
MTTHNGILFNLSSDTTFIPLSAIKSPDSIFIHEGIRRWSVVYYAGVLSTRTEVVEGKETEIKVIDLIFPVS